MLCSLFCNYVIFISMYVSIIITTICIYDFSEGPMADEQKLNGSLYYYYYYRYYKQLDSIVDSKLHIYKHSITLSCEMLL